MTSKSMVLVGIVSLLIHVDADKLESCTCLQQGNQRQDSLSNVYKRASREASLGIRSGFLKLYEIATKDVIYTVERSEVATRELHDLFIDDTHAWVRAFASLDKQQMQKFKEYLEWSGIVATVFAGDTISDETRYREHMLSRLSKLRGAAREKRFVLYLKSLLSDAKKDEGQR